MSKYEIALQLTLKAMESSGMKFRSTNNNQDNPVTHEAASEANAKIVSNFYNTVLSSLSI